MEILPSDYHRQPELRVHMLIAVERGVGSSWRNQLLDSVAFAEDSTMGWRCRFVRGANSATSVFLLKVDNIPHDAGEASEKVVGNLNGCSRGGVRDTKIIEPLGNGEVLVVEVANKGVRCLVVIGFQTVGLEIATSQSKPLRMVSNRQEYRPRGTGDVSA